MSPSTARPSDRFIPYFILAFFVALALLLAWFVWIAMRDYPGEVTRDAYRQGLEYNHIIENSAAQARLGWKNELHFTVHGLSIDMTFMLADKAGKPITDAMVKA